MHSDMMAETWEVKVNPGEPWPVRVRAIDRNGSTQVSYISYAAAHELLYKLAQALESDETIVDQGAAELTTDLARSRLARQPADG
jgi:hypothetical protein